MCIDKDLASIQEVRDLLKASKIAQAEYSDFDQEAVNRLVEAIAKECYKHAELLGKLANEETGFGIIKDKKGIRKE